MIFRRYQIWRMLISLTIGWLEPYLKLFLLASLRLTSNSLNGSILGINSDELRNMIHLDLENNNLTITSSSSLSSCQYLKILDLVGNKFSCDLENNIRFAAT